MPREIKVKTILNKTKRRDPWFLDDYTVNLYSSCGFNCLYCYIRGSKYGDNLETSLAAKTNAIELLDRALYNRAKKGQYGIIVLSSATEPYQKLDLSYALTRQALEVILKHRFPVHIITKSDGVARDYDILKEIDKTAILPKDLQISLGRGAIITYSFSTVDDSINAHFEPGATPPSVRLESLQETVENKFLSGVSMMPLLPFISDTTAHLDLMFSLFKRARAHYVMPATITLFGSGRADSKTLVMNVIKNHYPELEDRYHTYFDNSSGLPDFYKKAFQRKMSELALMYNLPNRIV